MHITQLISLIPVNRNPAPYLLDRRSFLKERLRITLKFIVNTLKTLIPPAPEGTFYPPCR